MFRYASTDLVLRAGKRVAAQMELVVLPLNHIGINTRRYHGLLIASLKPRLTAASCWPSWRKRLSLTVRGISCSRRKPWRVFGLWL